MSPETLRRHIRQLPEAGPVSTSLAKALTGGRKRRPVVRRVTTTAGDTDGPGSAGSRLPRGVQGVRGGPPDRRQPACTDPRSPERADGAPRGRALHSVVRIWPLRTLDARVGEGPESETTNP